jgi:hypothetical protein
MSIPIFGWIEPETVAIFIPMLAVLGGVFIAVTAVIMNGRRKELEHRERILAMEKGMPLPGPTPAAPERPKYSNRRANGLVLAGIGLALTIALSAEEGFAEGGVWGLIPLFIGIGWLVAGSIDKREWEAQQSRNHNSPM